MTPTGRKEDRCLVSFGSLLSAQAVAHTLMWHFDIDPELHRDVAAQMELAAGDALLDVGREVLTEHGLLDADGLALVPERGGSL